MATFIYPQQQITISGGATEAKQDVIILELQNIEADIESGNAAQATASNQTTIIAELQDIEADIESGNAAQATAANQTTIIAELQDIEADVEAGNTTLTSIDGKITAVDTDDVTITSSVLPTGAATSANQATEIASLSSIEADLTDLNARLAGNLVPELFDYIALTYVAAGNGAGEIETVTYRTGGAAGTIVATLTLAYDASSRLSTVTRS
jgi:hypothetical protein